MNVKAAFKRSKFMRLLSLQKYKQTFSFFALCGALFFLPVSQGCGGGGGSDTPTTTSTSTSTSTSTTTAAAANTNSSLGTNFDAITYFGTQLVFVDAFKASGPWTNADGGSTAIDTDSSGWVRSLQPGQVALTPIFSDLAPLSGTYIVLYEGEGSIEYSGYAVKDTQASRAGRDVVTVTPKMNDFFWLSISATNASNYIKNVRVLMPDKEGGSGATFESNYATQIFHPLFLERIKRYSTFRFMQGTIFNDLQNPGPQTWDGRPKTTDARWSVDDKGVPVEIMVALANRLHADAWFNMPHRADDDYVRQFATYVRDNLDTTLKAYIEYSNEVWNENFPQYQYAVQQGAGLSSDSFEGAMRFYSQRSVEIFRIWSGVFGSNSRLVRVLACHNEIPERGVMVMDWNNAYREADALAVGAYFFIDPADYDRVRNFTADQLVQDLMAKAIPLVATYTKANADNAKARNLPLIAYEGGQDMVVWGEPMSSALNTLFVAANRSALMQEAYTMHLNLWKSNGGTLFNHLMDVGSYQHSINGALETLTQEHSPKYDALMNFISATPKWW